MPFIYNYNTGEVTQVEAGSILPAGWGSSTSPPLVNSSLPVSSGNWATQNSHMYTGSDSDENTSTVVQAYQNYLNVQKLKVEENEMIKEKNKHYNIPIYRKWGVRKVEGEAVGLEIECEGKNLFTNPISYWAIHSDHSLRDVEGHPPCEYVLKQPLSVEATSKALNYLTGKLNETGSKLETSTRTSVHVHINCSHNTIQEVIKFICLYIIYEDILMQWCGETRVGNLFCLRVKDAQYFIELWEKALLSGEYKSIFHEEFRYMGCNVASIPKFGSVEFRGMRGTVDKEIIMAWVNILLKLKEKALTFESPRSIVEYFQKIGPRDFYEETFPYPVMFRNQSHLEFSMWEGLRLMRDIAYSVKWKEKLDIPEVEEIKSKSSKSDICMFHNTGSVDTTFYDETYGTGGYSTGPGSSVWIAVRPSSAPSHKFIYVKDFYGEISWRSYLNNERQQYDLP